MEKQPHTIESVYGARLYREVLAFQQNALQLLKKNLEPGVAPSDHQVLMDALTTEHDLFVAVLPDGVRRLQELNFEAFASFLSGDTVYG